MARIASSGLPSPRTTNSGSNGIPASSKACRYPSSRSVSD